MDPKFFKLPKELRGRKGNVEVTHQRQQSNGSKCAIARNNI
jgi:hypothetical protein